MGSRIRFAYADPPYIGCAKLYSGGKEVNHRYLVRHLEDDFDGWALSMHTNSLGEILGYCDAPQPRVLAWCKSYAPSRPNVQPVYAWEPVLLRKPKKRTSHYRLDHVTTLPGGYGAGKSKQRVLGEKPADFCVWMFECAGLLPFDVFVDVFPGSGAVSAAWRHWCQAKTDAPLQLEMPRET